MEGDAAVVLHKSGGPLYVWIFNHVLADEQPSAQAHTFGCLMQRARCLPGFHDGGSVRYGSHQLIAFWEVAGETSGTLHQAAECVRLGRWLFICKNVVENPDIQWPTRFVEYNRCVTLHSTPDILR